MLTCFLIKTHGGAAELRNRSHRKACSYSMVKKRIIHKFIKTLFILNISKAMIKYFLHLSIHGLWNRILKALMYFQHRIELFKVVTLLQYMYKIFTICGCSHPLPNGIYRIDSTFDFIRRLDRCTTANGWILRGKNSFDGMATIKCDRDRR